VQLETCRGSGLCLLLVVMIDAETSGISITVVEDINMWSTSVKENQMQVLFGTKTCLDWLSDRLISRVIVEEIKHVILLTFQPLGGLLYFWQSM
jgi:hypothetical protein